MSDRKHSQDFHFEFETRWGGVPSEVQKFEWWAAKQKQPIKYLCQHFLIPWYAKWWLDQKVEREMISVDKQAKDILKEWDEDAQKYYEPTIKSIPSEVDGLDELYLSYDSDPKTNYPNPDQWYQGPLEVFEVPEEGVDGRQSIPDPWER